MALTLVEAAKLSQNMLARGVMETFVELNPILDRIPFMTIEGNAFAYNEEATLPGVEFRAINGGYVESTGTVNQKTESLVILGGDADVDKFIVQTRGNLNDQRMEQEVLKTKAASYLFTNTFFNGDVAGDANSFDGIKKRLIGAQVIKTAVNGAPVVGNGASDAHTFFDKLDELVSLVPGLNGQNGAIYANSSVLGKIRSAGRRLGGVEMVREDLTGKRVLQWNGIPVLDPGATAAGVKVLPQTETEGTAVGTTASIYAVRYGQSEGDQAVTGLTNGGVQVYDLGEIDAKPCYRTRIEFYCGVGVFGGNSAARLTGVLNS